ncbi:MAG: MBL fold metallo-hydrolase [Clostridia bacterium]|nr:MBL fold metallo-hydrolase [Clostridia bacterium]
MNVVKIKYPLMDANSYLIYWEERQALLVDCVPHCFEKVEKICKSLNKYVTTILLTHGHIDHMIDAIKFQERGAKIYIGFHDRDKLHTDKNLAKMLGFKYEPTNADLFLKNGRYYLNGHHVDVVETPGHSAGSVCFFIEGVLFTGDTLFKGTVGRTDFEDSDYTKLMESIKLLKEKYTIDVPIYPGHGLETNFEIENEYNPYLKNL